MMRDPWKIATFALAGYSICVSAFLVSTIREGELDPLVTGSMAEWVGGIAAVTASSLALLFDL